MGKLFLIKYDGKMEYIISECEKYYNVRSDMVNNIMIDLQNLTIPATPPPGTIEFIFNFYFKNLCIFVI
jgi:hypothetical protein